MTTNSVHRLPADLNVKFVAGQTINIATAVLAIDSDAEGKNLYAACFDGGIYEIAIASGEKQLFGKHDSFASGVKRLSNGTVISSGYDGALQWFDAASRKLIRKVAAHKFWSWKMRVSPDQKLVGTVTGQYMAGGYKYEPAPEREPSVKVFDAHTGELRHEFPHVPPTLSVAFSPDSKHIAAANLMGEIRVWNLDTSKLVSTISTPDFTCWGIIKSHLYIGGIFDMEFSTDGKELLVCGMGPMVDPMAGNGKQTWQRFSWSANPGTKIGEIKDVDAGKGLMESIRFHPSGEAFIMAGKLAQGTWNAALFNSATGAMVHSVDTKMRVTDTFWLNGGRQVAFAGATGQGRKTDGKYPDFGHIKIYEVAKV